MSAASAAVFGVGALRGALAVLGRSISFSFGFLGFIQEDWNLSWSAWNSQSANSKLVGTQGLRRSACRNVPLERSDLLAARILGVASYRQRVIASARREGHFSAFRRRAAGAGAGNQTDRH